MIPKRTRRLRARAAAISTHDSEFEDYGPEPNMKLSHAFLVVLLLHVIAVGGLYAFNSMKAGKAPRLTASKSTPSEQPANPSGKQDSNSGEPKDQPPSGEKKAPLVAKTAEAPKVTKAVERAPEKPPAAENAPKTLAEKPAAFPRAGLLASAKAVFQRVTGLGVAGGGIVANAAAQENTNPPADTPAVAEPVASAKTYLVKAGDTMTRIAASLGVTIPDLEKANGLAGNAVLRVGQSLKVPEKIIAQAAAGVGAQAEAVAGSAQQIPGNIAAAATAAAATLQGASNAPVSTADLAEYTVVKGDNPYKIAKKFKVTPDELMKVNGITDPKKIQIGQKLKIPASQKKTPSTK